MLLRRLLILTVLTIAAFGHASVAYYRSYGPRSVTRLARPTITWEVWPSEGGKVTGWDMRINGKKVRAAYVADRRELQFKPEDAFAPGDYDVSAKVIVDGSLTVTRAWSFKVSTNTISRLPAPTERQQELLDDINSLRETLGLGPASLDDRLDASASAHSSYLRRNHVSGHFEQEGDPGFTGNSPGDRMEAFGYFGSSYEDVCTGSSTMREAVKMLYDAPYHRIPFMTPGEVLVGGAYEDGDLTLQFGMTEATKIVVSPAPGESNIPLSWNQTENPNPLRMHGIRGEIGYPIVFTSFGVDEPIKVSKATLKDEDGNVVPTLLSSPANDDHLDNAALVLPRAALRPGTTYRVEIKATDGGGRDISKSWSFRTRG